MKWLDALMLSLIPIAGIFAIGMVIWTSMEAVCHSL